MAEVVGIVGSAIAIADLAGKIIKSCKYYIESTHDAPSALREILIETSSMKSTCETLEFLSKNKDESTADYLHGKDMLLQECERLVGDIKNLFPHEWESAKPSIGDRSRTQKLKAALAWPLKESRVKKMLEQLRAHKSSITAAVTTEILINIRVARPQHNFLSIRCRISVVDETNRGNINEVKTKTVQIHESVQGLTKGYQRDKALKGLIVTDSSRDLHRKACRDFEPGTGNWVLRSDHWRDWLENGMRCLWIYGIPGSGKTVLASYLVEQVKNHCQRQTVDKCICIYYYCYYVNNRDEGEALLKIVIQELCNQADWVPDCLLKFSKSLDTSIDDLFEALGQLLTRVRCVYVIVDAVDESSPRHDIFNVLRHLAAADACTKLKLLVTSRMESDIVTVMQSIATGLPMDNRLVQKDIAHYVQTRMNNDEDFEHWPVSVRQATTTALSEKAKGMFRWARCQLDLIRDLEPTIENIQFAIIELPETLDETYRRIFHKHDQVHHQFVKNVMKWIFYYNEIYQKPIPSPILLQAIERTATHPGTNEKRYKYSEKRLRQICGCLIDISSDEEDLVLRVSFAHYTVWEFLEAARTAKYPGAFYAINKSETVLELLEITIAEVISSQWQNYHIDEDFSPEDYLSDFQLNSVMTAVIAIYALTQELSQNKQLCALVFELLSPSRSHYESVVNLLSEDELMDQLAYMGMYTPNLPWQINWTSELHEDACILINLAVIDESGVLVKKFLEEADIKSLSEVIVDFTMLDWHVKDEGSIEEYAFQGHIVDLFASRPRFAIEPLYALLDSGFKIFHPSFTLLNYMGSHVHQNHSVNSRCSVTLLLGYGADPDISGYKVTPLQIAVACRDVEGVRMLLEAGADPNNVGDREGREWDEDAFPKRFNCLHGASPLRICEYYSYIRCAGDGEDEKICDRKGIRTLLREHRARDFHTEFGDEDLLANDRLSEDEDEDDGENEDEEEDGDEEDQANVYRS